MNNLKKGPIKFLDLTQDSHKRLFSKAFEKVLSSGVFILGENLKNFEGEFAKYLGTKYCIGVGNGLEALQIALISIGVGKNDEVITTPISAAATILAILATGAKPVFVDVTKDGLIDPNLIYGVITKKTKAILPVHLYGCSANLESIKKICKKYNLYLIEDASQAHGSKYKNKFLGTFGALGCFSFYPTKNLGALGDAGAIITNNKKLAKICFEIRDYGQKTKYHHVRFGLNSRLDELQAAFLNIKLTQLDFDNKKRTKLAQRYLTNLSSIEKIQIIQPKKDNKSNFHLFVIKTKQRDKLANYLKKRGIQTLIHYPLIIPDQPMLKKEYSLLNLPVARNFVKTCLSLPLYPKMTFEQVDFISLEIKEFFK